MARSLLNGSNSPLRSRAILVTPALPAPHRYGGLAPAARPNRLRTVLPLADADPDSGEHAQRRLLSRFAQAGSVPGGQKGRVLDITA